MGHRLKLLDHASSAICNSLATVLANLPWAILSSAGGATGPDWAREGSGMLQIGKSIYANTIIVFGCNSDLAGNKTVWMGINVFYLSDFRFFVVPEMKINRINNRKHETHNLITLRCYATWNCTLFEVEDRFYTKQL